MGINIVTYAAKTVTPQDDALIYEKALQESGMIYGGTVTIKSANVLHVAEGHGALCGRKFTIEETDIAVPLTASGSLLGRLYIHMDLADSGEPISFQVETANSLTPVVQQSDVNINNGIYEINIATFTVDTSTISNLVNVAPFINIAPDSTFSAQSNNPLMNKVITKALGDPETIGGSASKGYAKGALMLSKDGQIYEVTASINQGGTITNNGNVKTTGNVITQISNLANRGIINSNSFSSSYGTFESGYTNIVYTHEFASFNMRFEPNKSVPAWTTIATLPGGIKPRCSLSACAGEGGTMRTVVRINTNGAIIVENALSSGQNIECNFSFFINW